MKEYRFMKEYCNFVKGRYKASDLPKEQKERYQKDLDMIIRNVHRGLLTLSEGMMELAKADRWISDYNTYGGLN